MSSNCIFDQLQAWAEAGANGERLDRAFVHKMDMRNVLLARVAPAADHPDQHVAELAIDDRHPYHFEHAQDHVPGMMLIEAGRQMAMAIAHLYYQVPLDVVFVLNEVSISFSRFAELGRPVFIHSTVADKVQRRDQLAAMSLGGDFIQGGEVLGSMSGRWTMLDRALIERLRRRARGDAAAAGPGDAARSRVG
jgi:hypothetical protein